MVWAYPSNITGFASLFQYVNTDLLDGLLGLFLSIAIFFFFYIMSCNRYDEEQSMIFASFMTIISNIFLWVLELTSFRIMIFFVLICFFIGIYNYFKRGQGN